MNQRVLNYDTVVTASANVKDTVRIEPQDSKKLLSGELTQPSFFPHVPVNKVAQQIPKRPILAL